VPAAKPDDAINIVIDATNALAPEAARQSTRHRDSCIPARTVTTLRPRQFRDAGGKLALHMRQRDLTNRGVEHLDAAVADITENAITHLRVEENSCTRASVGGCFSAQPSRESSLTVQSGQHGIAKDGERRWRLIY